MTQAAQNAKRHKHLLKHTKPKTKLTNKYVRTAHMCQYNCSQPHYHT